MVKMGTELKSGKGLNNPFFFFSLGTRFMSKCIHTNIECPYFNNPAYDCWYETYQQCLEYAELRDKKEQSK